MKRLNPIFLAVLLTLSFAVAGLAQQTAKTSEQKQTTAKQQAAPARAGSDSPCSP